MKADSRCSALTRRAGTIAALALIGYGLNYAVREGRHLQRVSPEIFLGAAPLVGRNFRDGWDWRWSWATPLAVVIGSVVVVLTHRRWWQQASMRALLATTSLLAAAFAVVLAAVDGVDGLVYGAEHKTEYLANLDKVDSAASFVRHFVRDIDAYSVHVRGHPPAFMVLIKWMDTIGLTGVWPVVGLSIIATAVLPVAVLWTVRLVVNEHSMRAAAPWLVVCPSALWMMTSGDAVFTAVAATATALTASAVQASGSGRMLRAGLAGLLLGLLLFLTYLGAVFFAIPGFVLLRFATRRWRASVTTGVVMAIGIVAVVVLFWWAGFWWYDGVERTKIEYWEGSAQFRRRNYFLVANVAAALAALGPATVFGVARLRRSSMWWLVAAGTLALLVSNFSQYTRGEVERIWLLFYPWIALAAVGLMSDSATDVAVSNDGESSGRLARLGSLLAATRPQRWVALQAVAAIVLQSALVSKW
jgi:methylthioxylose transferase